MPSAQAWFWRRKTERKMDFVQSLSARDNIALPNLGPAGTGALGAVRSLEQARMVEVATKDFQIKTPNAEADAASLSGGNQQKVVVSKWLARNSRVVIFDEQSDARYRCCRKG